MQNATQHAAGRFEKALGKARSQWTLDEVVELFMSENFQVVGLMHVGGDGWLKTLDFVPRDEAHLRDILQGGERADGSSLFPGTGIEAGASDIVLRPRIATAFADPFAPVPTMAFLCGHIGRDGSPLPESPDTIVRAAHQRVIDETDTELWALGEVEYFLGKPIEDARAALNYDDRGYHATAPFVFGEGLRRRAMGLLGDMGVPVKYGHSEVGYIPANEGEDLIWEQHEVELALAPLPRAADAIALTCWVLRNLAWRESMRCSFAPIMRKGHAGSGLHVHMSPVKDGRHLPVPQDDAELPPEARWLIGGLARMGGALMAFGNRTEGSFVRLTQGKEAPNRVTWGRFNRHALIRLPIQATTEEGRSVSVPTVEFRLADGSAHAHLLLAGLAQAMCLGKESESLDALLEQTRAGGPASKKSSPVPRTFGEVANSLRTHYEHLTSGGIFPERFLQLTLATLDDATSRGMSPL